MLWIATAARPFLTRAAELPKLQIFATSLLGYGAFGIIVGGIGGDLTDFINSLSIVSMFGIRVDPSMVHIALVALWPALFWYISPDYTIAAIAMLVGTAAYVTHLHDRYRSAHGLTLALEDKLVVLRCEIEHFAALPRPSASAPELPMAATTAESASATTAQFQG